MTPKLPTSNISGNQRMWKSGNPPIGSHNVAKNCALNNYLSENSPPHVIDRDYLTTSNEKFNQATLLFLKKARMANVAPRNKPR